jgi:hypothetical protein
VGFQHESTLAGYARAAVDLKIRMTEYFSTSGFAEYAHNLLSVELSDDGTRRLGFTDRAIAQLSRYGSTTWQRGEPNVLAPAMTAVIAAAANTLDLTGEVLTEDIAPAGAGVLFLPEPIYQRQIGGTVHSVGAITWARAVPIGDGQPFWRIAAWADLHDPHDLTIAAVRQHVEQQSTLAAALSPYLFIDSDTLPIGTPVQGIAWSDTVDSDQDWQSAPDGRYVLDTTSTATKVCSRIAYAFWRISAQPLATVAQPPLERPARRRATRACIAHHTRVVMLRRTSPVTDRSDGDAKWRYRVRFAVRGHWRRLHDKDGRPYRIWINAYIKGPDGAPLLHGEKVAVLAR